MHRFYVPNIEFPHIEAPGSGVAGRGAIDSGATHHAISIYGPTARQLKTVLRAKVGDRIRLFDGSGSEWEVEIDHVGRTEISATLVSAMKPVPEPSARVTVLLGLARPERIELAIQKCTELGAIRFVPVISERVQGGATGAPSAKRLERWQRIAIEAAEQCGRATVPAVDSPLQLMDAVSQLLGEQALLCMWEERADGSVPLRVALKEINSVNSVEGHEGGSLKLAALIGPPGGFSEHEAGAIQAAGARLVTLGPRVLRSETAAITVMSAILYEMGDLGG